MNIKMTSKTANILLLIASLVWGSGFVGTQLALDEGLTPLQIIFARMFVAGISLTIMFFKRLKEITLPEIKAGVIIAFYLFFGFYSQTYGLQYTTPSINAFVTAVYVILIPFIKFFLMKDKPDIYSNVGAVLTVIGIGLISLTDGFSISLGVFLTLVCAVFYAFQVIYTDIYVKKYDPLKLTVIVINITTVFAFVACLISAGVNNDLPKITTNGILSVVYLGLVCTCIAYICQNVAQKYTQAVKAAIILSLESVFGAILSAIIYKEVFTTQMIIGCVVIFSAILISELKPNFFKKNSLSENSY